MWGLRCYGYLEIRKEERLVIRENDSFVKTRLDCNVMILSGCEDVERREENVVSFTSGLKLIRRVEPSAQHPGRMGGCIP